MLFVTQDLSAYLQFDEIRTNKNASSTAVEVTLQGKAL